MNRLAVSGIACCLQLIPILAGADTNGPPPPGAAWRLDGKRLGAARPLPWSPWPGHHVLDLVDAKGGVLDTVSFDVRGAQARSAAAPARASAKTARLTAKPVS